MPKTKAAAYAPPRGSNPTRTFVAKFDRISRDHNVPDLTVTAYEGDTAKGSHPGPEQSADQIAEQVYRYAWNKTISRDIEVVVDLDKMTGTIYAGFQVAGSFTLTETT